MGFFDFLKRKKQELEEPLEEKISFNEIDNWIDKRKQKIKDEQKPNIKQIKENLNELVSNLEQRGEVLRNLNLDEKKAPERAMSIVRENFDKFIYELEKLIINLKEIDGDENKDYSLESLINKINSIFAEFEKKSITSYQKSTFLIGDELGAVTKDIAKFFKGFNKIIKENDFSIKQSKVLSVINKKLKEIGSLNKTREENKKNTNEMIIKIGGFEAKIYELKKQVEEKKQTSEYVDYVDGKNKLESNKTKLVIELQALKELIDFKALAKVYHSIVDKMNLVKEFKENFNESFEKYGNEKFLGLVDIEDIDKKAVKERVESIDFIKEGLKNIEKDVVKDVTLELINESNSFSDKIHELHAEKNKIETRNKRLIEDVEKIKEDIAEKFKEINVIISD